MQTKEFCKEQCVESLSLVQMKDTLGVQAILNISDDEIR